MQFARKMFGPLGFLAASVALVVACGDDDFAGASGGDDDDASVPSSSSSSGGIGASSSSGSSGVSSSSSSGAVGDAGGDGSTEVGDSGACDSTVALVIDADAESKARAALAVADPGGTGDLTWNAPTGTLHSLNFWNTQLTDCTGDDDVYDALEAFLVAHADIFQIDPTEWARDGVVKCSSITDLTTIHLRRLKYGSYGERNDVFNAVISPIDGVLTMRNYSGVYLPKPSAAMTAALAACADKPEAELVAPLSEKLLEYNTFAEAPAPICTIDGDGEYTRSTKDSLTLDEGTLLQWEDDGSGTVKVHRERTATVVVDPANYTPDLIRSDANCIDLDGGNHIGWTRHFDPGSGNVLYDHPTPDPTCTVCLK